MTHQTNAAEGRTTEWPDTMLAANDPSAYRPAAAWAGARPHRRIPIGPALVSALALLVWLAAAVLFVAVIVGGAYLLTSDRAIDALGALILAAMGIVQ